MQENDRRTGIAGAERITGYHRTTIWRKLRDPASRFPPPVYVGERRTWLESELLAWVADQAARPRGPKIGRTRNLAYQHGEAKP